MQLSERLITMVGVQEAGGGLLTTMDAAAVGRATTDAAIAAQWFSQDVFAAAPALGDIELGVQRCCRMPSKLQNVCRLCSPAIASLSIKAETCKTRRAIYLLYF